MRQSEERLAAILSDLHALPPTRVASDDEVLRRVEDRKLSGKGLGRIDAHLLASAIVTNCRFWTLDKRLAKVAEEFQLR